MKELEGKIIKQIFIDKDEQHYILFKTDAGNIVYHADADCCSESWFYHILGFDNLINHKVVSVEEIDTGDAPEDGRCRQEYDDLYCIKIKTEKGHADIEFRNSSNGYYGGWLELHSTDGKLPEGVKFKKITDDYTSNL